MLEIIALLCLIGAIILLFILSAIDLREGLLPNELVMGLFCVGCVFHLSTLGFYLSAEEMALGGFIGAASLYLVRAVANWAYKDDALGLGDVKLMGAAGLWLGPYYILVALTLGAMSGIVHGLLYAAQIRKQTGKWPNMNTLSLPAGPGFAVGIIITGMILFRSFPMEFLL